MKTILICDLDTPIYKAAVRAQDKSILVTHTKTGIEKTFNNRTEFKELLKGKNKLSTLPQYEIVDVQVPHPVSHATQILKTTVNSIVDFVKPDEVIYLVSGKGNFREDIPFVKRYKWNREDTLKPVNLQATRNFAIKHFKAVRTNGEEPDDAQVWMGYEVLAAGNKPIVLGYDKDSLQYSGLFVYNPDKPDLGIRELPETGSISLDSKRKPRAEGLMQYAYQMLYGDRVDGLNPYEVAGVKFGEIAAFNVLKDLKDEKEILQAVVNQYKMWYPSDVKYTAWNGEEVSCTWREMYSMYHKALRMKQTKDDPLSAKDFLNSRGVQL